MTLTHCHIRLHLIKICGPYFLRPEEVLLSRGHNSVIWGREKINDNANNHALSVNDNENSNLQKLSPQPLASCLKILNHSPISPIFGKNKNKNLPSVLIEMFANTLWKLRR